MSFIYRKGDERSLSGEVKRDTARTHNLVYLLNKIGVKPVEATGRFVIKLNEADVVTRYPEDIDKLQKDYTQVVVKDMLIRSKEVPGWIKKQY